MKRILVFTMALCFMLAVIDCRALTYKPTIIYDGKLYRVTFREVAGDVDPSAILGTITSVVPPSELPTEEGQANFGDTDTPYAMTDIGLVVLYGEEWVLLTADE